GAVPARRPRSQNLISAGARAPLHRNSRHRQALRRTSRGLPRTGGSETTRRSCAGGGTGAPLECGGPRRLGIFLFSLFVAFLQRSCEHRCLSEINKIKKPKRRGPPHSKAPPDGRHFTTGEGAHGVARAGRLLGGGGSVPFSGRALRRHRAAGGGSPGRPA